MDKLTSAGTISISDCFQLTELGRLLHKYPHAYSIKLAIWFVYCTYSCVFATMGYSSVCFLFVLGIGQKKGT